MKKVLAWVLICIMVFGLVACDKTPTENTPTKDKVATDVSLGDDSIVSSEPVTFTMFIDHSWYPVEDFVGIIPEEITRITNVTLDPTVAIDAEQLGVLIGSGDLPDLVYTQNMVDQLSDGDLCYSYEELMDEYNVSWDLSPKQLGIGRGYSQDDTAYTILNHYSEKEDWVDSSAVPMVGSILYRKDIWEAIGSPALESFDDLYDAFGKVHEMYPEMTPIKLSDTWNTATLRFLKGMGNLEYLEQDDGTQIHFTRDPRYKEILAWANKCMRAGYMHPDESFFVSGSEAAPVGNWFMLTSSTQNALYGSLADHKKIDENYIVAEMVPFEESDYLTTDLGWSGTFITKQNHNPEAAIKFIAWMFTPAAQALTQMGREGIEYTLDENGLPQFSEEWKKATEDGTHNQVYNPWFYLGGSELVEADSRVAVNPTELCAEAYTVIRERFENHPWVMAAAPIGSSDEKVISDKIKELVKVYDTKIIMAKTEEEFETMYQEYLDNAETTGLAQLEAYVTEQIEVMMPMYQ